MLISCMLLHIYEKWNQRLDSQSKISKHTCIPCGLIWKLIWKEPAGRAESFTFTFTHFYISHIRHTFEATAGTVTGCMKFLWPQKGLHEVLGENLLKFCGNIITIQLQNTHILKARDFPHWHLASFAHKAANLNNDSFKAGKISPVCRYKGVKIVVFFKHKEALKRIFIPTSSVKHKLAIASLTAIQR